MFLRPEYMHYMHYLILSFLDVFRILSAPSYMNQHLVLKRSDSEILSQLKP
jgi:hypothetical protein